MRLCDASHRIGKIVQTILVQHPALACAYRHIFNYIRILQLYSASHILFI